eukprot:TRINITY_DN14770_c0_g1_i1.p1 TRINITY_DN14770_c0_g1~~TRINITY_DN14770_c0_g1_i1.p1  ORF type:complete len:305 (+),score=49.54 TRINITY_DN14770_c0_g1_i1:186-1100(+)
MSFESLSHLLGGEDPDLTLVVTGVVLSISVVALCWLFPCLPDSRSSKKDEPYYGTEAAEVTSLRVYPIKSCAGHEVDCWELTKTGLKYDRNWVVVGADGRFRSQRRLPKMAVVTPSLPTSDTDPLIIKAPGMPELVVPARRRGDAGAKEVPVGVWGDQCTGIDQGEEAAAWLSKCLGEPGLRLLRYDDAFTRGTDPAYGRGFFTAYSDGFPLPPPAVRLSSNYPCARCTADEWTECVACLLGRARLRAQCSENARGVVDRWSEHVVGGGLVVWGHSCTVYVRVAAPVIVSQGACSKCIGGCFSL